MDGPAETLSIYRASAKWQGFAFTEPAVIVIKSTKFTD
ncbi:hypothetical protein [Devosia sp. DBB001]|nr:hypothetical protein [Devosia sp. DBB001]